MLTAADDLSTTTIILLTITKNTKYKKYRIGLKQSQARIRSHKKGPISHAHNFSLYTDHYSLITDHRSVVSETTNGEAITRIPTWDAAVEDGTAATYNDALARTSNTGTTTSCRA